MFQLYRGALAAFAQLKLPISNPGGEVPRYNKPSLKRRLLLNTPLASTIAWAALGVAAYERRAWL